MTKKLHYHRSYTAAMLWTDPFVLVISVDGRLLATLPKLLSCLVIGLRGENVLVSLTDL